jgi:hypothetical protein
MRPRSHCNNVSVVLLSQALSLSKTPPGLGLTGCYQKTLSTRSLACSFSLFLLENSLGKSKGGTDGCRLPRFFHVVVRATELRGMI